MRSVMTVAVLALLAASAVRAGEASASPEVTGPGSVEVEAVRDVRDDFRAETSKSMRATWVWAAVAVGSGIYAGAALAGRAGGPPVAKYLSIVGVLAGLTGAAREGSRAHSIGKLRAGLEEGLNASAGEPVVRLSAEVLEGTGTELHGRLNRLRRSSRGALRAGCVLPVLLGGIGIYGLTVSSSGGDVLAGVGVGGALVIGAPSMLSYFGLQERLKRTERLVARWDDALLGQEMTQ